MVFRMTLILASEDPAFPGAKPLMLPRAPMVSPGNGHGEILFLHERSQFYAEQGLGLRQGSYRS